MATATLVKGGSRVPVLLELKAWFLGRFLSSNLTEDSLSRLRSHVASGARGKKTKIRLSSQAFSFGHRSTGLLKDRLPYEFVPLIDIEGMFVDSLYSNLLLCVTRILAEELGSEQQRTKFEITAFRLPREEDCLRFQHAYSEIRGRYFPGETVGVLVDNNNTLEVTADRKERRGEWSTQWGRTGRWIQNASSADHVDGDRQQRFSSSTLEDAALGHRQTETLTRHYDFQREEWGHTARVPTRDVSTHVDFPGSGGPCTGRRGESYTDKVYYVSGRPVADVGSQAEPDYGLDTLYDGESSTTSESDAMKNQIADLTREVTQLRQMMGEKAVPNGSPFGDTFRSTTSTTTVTSNGGAARMHSGAVTSGNADVGAVTVKVPNRQNVNAMNLVVYPAETPRVSNSSFRSEGYSGAVNHTSGRKNYVMHAHTTGRGNTYERSRPDSPASGGRRSRTEQHQTTYHRSRSTDALDDVNRSDRFRQMRHNQDTVTRERKPVTQNPSFSQRSSRAQGHVTRPEYVILRPRSNSTTRYDTGRTKMWL